MPSATVYRFKVFNIYTCEYKFPPKRGTREAIEGLGGEPRPVVIEESAEEVNAELLDGDGFIRDPKG
ncbi:hypothetical protein X897_6195 [Burkholderia pseudomallei ABCPW 30]|uniref:hypothetical protein n=1 Tax=Burkholderia pseudomallei TaxID=28450 RepID=UPI00050E8C84|nr:hypothetical protein [Burkholderia pseudomallei]KGD37430.1 hypothetical protein DP44_1598 [Burkholderia pseudomallei]KGW01954.1 hypothetical protein X897_6195 [Burkholderia pseudomallei ABCPW 30]